MNELLYEFIDFLKDTGSFVWPVLIKQAYTEATVGFICGIVFLVTSFLCFKLYKKAKEKNYIYVEAEVLAMASVSCGLISISFLTYAVMRFSNPEFYAIRFLIDKLAE